MTRDATYRGRQLTNAAWAEHLAMLRNVAAGRPPDVMRLDDVGHQAWVAIGQAGLVRDTSTRATDGSFRWAQWELSELGRVYLAGRTAT